MTAAGGTAAADEALYSTDMNHSSQQRCHLQQQQQQAARTSAQPAESVFASLQYWHGASGLHGIMQQQRQQQSN
jgi:hypothetical protein